MFKLRLPLRASFCHVLFLGIALCGLSCGGEAASLSPCAVYLDCLEASEADQARLEAANDDFGADGTCFDERSQEGCELTCRSRVEDIAEMFESVGMPLEACELPPEAPDESPLPDADGYIDCAEVDAASTIGPGPTGITGYPELACHPGRSGIDEFLCCSDGAAAVGGTPNYEPGAPSGDGTPYFSGANNEAGDWGLCVRTGDVPAGVGLVYPPGCPVACNPTWATEDVHLVCGLGMNCCQTRELEPEDCIEDPAGTWRPVTGADLLLGRTDWAPGRHATHQDPGADACADAAEGREGPAYEACVTELGAADQRGFCNGGAGGCPLDDPNYLDACEQINAGIIPPPGGS